MVSLGLTNSYDTWHGNNSFAKEKVYNVLYTHTETKNVAKQMAKISQGRVRDKRVTWFPELADKSMFMCEDDVLISISLHAIGKNIKTHLYWCMRNCEEKADHLKSLVDNIPNHYQVYFLH